MWMVIPAFIYTFIDLRRKCKLFRIFIYCLNSKSECETIYIFTVSNAIEIVVHIKIGNNNLRYTLGMFPSK